jgi:FkbM family methyltransferase
MMTGVSQFDTEEAARINAARKSFLEDFLSGLMAQGGVKRVLDVGCGYGYFSNYLKSVNLHVVALDGRRENATEAKRRYPEIDFHVYDIEDPSCRTLGSFDLVLCFGLLYHLENPFQVIRNLFALSDKYLIIETMIMPYRSSVAVLFEESRADNQGLRYLAWIPTQSGFVKMLYQAGFSGVYRPTRWPDHEQFHRSLTRRRARTILLVTKGLGADPVINFGKAQFRLIPEPSVPVSALFAWDSLIGKLLRPLRTPQAFGLYVFDLVSNLTPAALIVRACNALAIPRPLRCWPGWVLGAGDYKAHPPTLIRLLLWRAFSSKTSNSPFIIKWHNGIRILAYPKVQTCLALFVTGFYEPNEFSFLNRILRPGMVFIDIGANLGLYSLFASTLVGEEGTVLAIEPSEREFQRLKMNAELNHGRNIRLLQIGLSNESSERNLRIADEVHSGHNTFGHFAYTGVQQEGQQRARVQRLDDLVRKEGYKRVDVIKIDAEGHELFVLQGAVETIKQFKPTLFVELFDRSLSLQGCTSDQVWDFLIQMGYQIYQFDAVTGLPVLAEKKQGYQENIVAIHRDRG